MRVIRAIAGGSVVLLFWILIYLTFKA